jgi:hypothetical protein
MDEALINKSIQDDEPVKQVQEPIKEITKPVEEVKERVKIQKDYKPTKISVASKDEEIVFKEEKEATKKKLVAKPLPSKRKPRMNPDVTPSFLLDKKSGYTYF